MRIYLLFFCFILIIPVLFQCKSPKRKKESPETLFTDVAREENVISRHTPLKDIQRLSSGAAWLDADNDGDLDIYVSNVGGSNQLFRNNRIGSGKNNFTEIAEGDAQAINSYTAGIAVADYDNDGDNDIYLTNLNEDVLLQNDGAGKFRDITHIAFQTDKRFLFEFGASASWGDVNNDGWLDLYVANNAPNNKTTFFSRDYLFINNGGDPVTFTDRTDLLTGDYDEDAIQDIDAIGFMGLFTDYNLDGFLDIYVVNDCPYGPEDNKLWKNNGNLHFTEVSNSVGPFTRGKFLGGRVVNDCHNAMGITCGDPNHDGYPDYHFTNVHYQQQNTVLLQNSGRYLINVSAEAGLDNVEFDSRRGMFYSWGTVFVDYDLDTWEDLANATGSLFGQNNQPNMLFHNMGADVGGTPHFRRTSLTESGIGNVAQSRTLIRGDYDMDGDPDLFLVNFDSLASLYQNNNHNGNNWLIVETKGAGPPLSNRNGIAAKVYATTSDHLKQFAEIRSGSSMGGGDDIAAYFGLAKQDKCEIEILWPSGIRQEIKNASVNRRIKISEPSIGVVFPKGGEFLVKEKTYVIKWKTPIIGEVKILLQKQGQKDIVIAKNIDNTGEYSWHLNKEIPEGQEYELVIQGSENSSLEGKTNYPFSIVNPATSYCELTYPNGRELVERGKILDITWKGNSKKGTVNIALLNGEDKVMDIINETENDGSFEWPVPDTLEGNSFKIVIKNESGLEDQNDNSFSIVKKIIEPQLPKKQLQDRTKH